MSPSRPLYLSAALLLGLALGSVPGRAAGAGAQGTPLTSLITTVAHDTGRKFVLDPGVAANVVLIGENPGRVTYPQLLTLLATEGYAAVPEGDYVRIVPDHLVRVMPLPVVGSDARLPDDQVVTTVFIVHSVPAGWLVPILRPLVPQWGHLAAMPCTNALVIVEQLANVRRLEAVVRALDKGPPIKHPRCAIPMPR